MAELTQAGKVFLKRVKNEVMTEKFFAGALQGGYGPQENQSLGEWVVSEFDKAEVAIRERMSFERRPDHSGDWDNAVFLQATQVSFDLGNSGNDSTTMKLWLQNMTEPELAIKLAGSNFEGAPWVLYAVFVLDKTMQKTDVVLGHYRLSHIQTERPDHQVVLSHVIEDFFPRSS